MLEHWIWLSQIFYTGSRKTDHLMELFDGAEAVYDAAPEEYRAVKRLDKIEYRKLLDKDLRQAKEIISGCMKRGYRILPYDDPAYPANLRMTSGCPLVLYVWGDLENLLSQTFFAMVGTRDCTSYGIEAASKIGGKLARSGGVIVSGLAVGIDTYAHEAALKSGGKTVAVLGCGIDIDYPVRNRSLKQRIAESGAVISEFAPGVKPVKYHFPVRNRIISGLSAATLVIECGIKSGSLITAMQAAEQGRDLYALPGSVFSPMSEGTNRLIQDGVKPLLSAEQVIEDYGLETVVRYAKTGQNHSGAPKNDRQLSFDLSGQNVIAESRLHTGSGKGPVFQGRMEEILLCGPLTLEEMIEKLEKPAGLVAAAVTSLEIRGVLERDADGRLRLV